MTKRMVATAITAVNGIAVATANVTLNAITAATAITVALFTIPAAAQLAPPQWSRPAMDSTHVTGTAARVMPEMPEMPFKSDAGLPRSVTAPASIAELLAAFDGVLLEMPGNEQAGAFEQLRFLFSREKMQSQFTALWNWYDGCSVDARVHRCSHGNYSIFLSPEGLTVVRQGCGALNGSAGGSAEFRWSDFVGLGGPTAADKRWLLQRDTFWGSCYANVGSSD